MRKLFLTLLLLSCILSLARAGQDTGEADTSGLPPLDFTRDTLSLPTAYFPEMPQDLRDWLEKREYRIPQVHDLFMDKFGEGLLRKKKIYNVSAGNYNGIGEQDWVFVVSRNDTLRAFICWDSNIISIEQLDISEFNPDQGGFRDFTFRSKHVCSYTIVLSKIRKEWLNENVSSNLHKIYGDSSKLPASFTHDGFVFESGGDMWTPGFVRYFDRGHWYRFYHWEALKKATLDTLLLKKRLKK